ncbi:MAG: (2Fe-2S)-binding protein [Candidatus Wallbacteria bacterium]|nr:(2Fe-2S)-binding protein [Candidatus Wallbacteria bacterium]
MKISFKINGDNETRDVNPSKTLLRFIREDLNLTGTKEGCGEGECGACTVILNGKAVHSCLTLAAEIDGAEVTTVEGLVKNGELDILQNKFMEHNAIQCGFCTPGMLMAAKALLMVNQSPSELEIRRAMAGNICRCTGYKPIIDAVKDAARGGRK